MSDFALSNRYEIVEGISGVWHYHIALAGKPSTSLCGRPTMKTAAKNSTWGFVPGHMPTSYCSACAEMAKEGT